MVSRRVALVLPKTALDPSFWPGFYEISAWLADALRRSGWSVERVPDGDPSLLEVDVTLLFGDCDQLRRSATALRRAEGRRPRTVLWQLDSLPPPRMGPASVAAGLRRARSESALRLPTGRTSNLLRSAVGSYAARRVKWFLVRAASGRSAVAHGSRRAHLSDLEADARRFRRLEWIERAVGDGWLDRVAVSAPERAGVLSDRGIRATFIPIGYHPAMGTDREQERDLDAVFLGGATPYRDGILPRLRVDLAGKGVNLVVPPPPVFGEKRSVLLNRARVVLNIHREGGFWELSRLRLLYAMACGASVVSEPVTDPTPFVEGSHFVTAGPDRLPDVTAALVRDESRRRGIVEEARRLLTTELTMERSAAALVS